MPSPSGLPGGGRSEVRASGLHELGKSSCGGTDTEEENVRFALKSNLSQLKPMHPLKSNGDQHWRKQGRLTGKDGPFSTIERNQLLFRHGKCLYKHV